MRQSAKQRRHLQSIRLAKQLRDIDGILERAPPTGSAVASVDIGHDTFVRRKEAADRMLRYAMRTGLNPEAARCVTCMASCSAPLGHFCSSAIFPSVFPDSESAVELRDPLGTWVTTTMLLPRSSATPAELQLLESCDTR